MTARDDSGDTSIRGTQPGNPATATPGSGPTGTGVGGAGTGRRLGVEEVGFIALLLLATVGMAVADFSARWGLWYWLMVIPLFAAASAYASWRHERAAAGNVGAVLLRQLLHWGTLALAMYLVLTFEGTGRLNREDAGLVALLALSLTTVLAGVHFDWRLAVLGLLLAAVAACVALVEEFFWILLVPFVVAGIVVVLWRRRGS